MLADLGFFGNVGRKEQQMFPAYAIVAGARIADGEARLARQIDRVNARDLPEFVHDLLELWLQKKSRFNSFSEYIDGEGTADIKSIADKYRTIPEVAADANYCTDWGATSLFSLVGKGVGECSAGLFDLIEVDLKLARRLRDEVASNDSSNDQALYAITLSSARALLITRAIEAPTDAAVFEYFRKHFIHSGLVDTRFLPLIAAAQQLEFAALSELSPDVFALLDAVDALYKSMDNSLRFSAAPALTT
jgi:sulfite reductase (ferredoxin)